MRYARIAKETIKACIEYATKPILHKRINSATEIDSLIQKAKSSVGALKVSVVIPTYNGVNDGLERLLNSLRQQTHTNLEIVAVDTSSSDGTVDLLKKYDAKIVTITKEQFRHDFARNLGAEQASGDLLLFTVQDAEFDNPNWVELALCQMQANSNVVSLTSYQYTPATADLYAQCLSYNFIKHNNYEAPINILGSSWLSKWKLRLVYFGHLKARRIHIDDTNHLVKRDFFLKHKYDLETCEDMGFGKKVIYANKQFIYSTLISVHHHHSYRNIAPYAKRVFLDSLVINKLLGRKTNHQTNAALYFDAAIITTCFALQVAKRFINNQDALFHTNPHWVGELSKQLNNEQQNLIHYTQCSIRHNFMELFEDPEISSFIKQLNLSPRHFQTPEALYAATVCQAETSELLKHILGSVNHFFGIANNQGFITATTDINQIQHMINHAIVNACMTQLALHYHAPEQDAANSACLAAINQWVWV